LRSLFGFVAEEQISAAFTPISQSGIWRPSWHAPHAVPLAEDLESVCR
jgi:hypothetical protein